MIEYIAMFFYSIVSNLFVLFMFFLTIFVKNNKLSNRLLLHKKYRYNHVIWIHAASVGEVISTEALIKNIANKLPNSVFLFTSHTETSKNIIETRYSNLKNITVLHHYLPYDTCYLANKFIKFYKPSLVLWIEQDFFPTILKTINKNKIPLLLLNARMSDKSYNLWLKFLPIIKTILGNFNKIFAMSELDKQKYFKLSNNINVQYIGNLKYTNVSTEVDLQKLQKLSNYLKGKTILLAISTHEGEEQILFNTHLKLSKNFSNIVTIIIPRHTKRIENIMQKQEFLNNALLYSNINYSKDFENNVVLVDTVGDVDLFCSIADITFVGKSLSVAKGGHNIIEPLKFNNCVIFGNNMFNFHEIVSLCLEHKAGFMVNNEKELLIKIQELLSNNQLLKQTKNNASFIIKNADNIVESFTKEVVQCLVK